MSKGFFVPNSVSSQYVSNKKTSEGAYQWDQANQEVGLGQQAAFQTINKQYANTINAAYSNYLAANHGIRGSTMGQEYKQAYTQLTQEQLAAQVAETNLTAGQLRQEVNQGAEGAKSQIEEMFQGEVANMDRTAKSASGYLEYLKSLTGSMDASKTYLSPDQASLSIDDMYDTVFQAQPQNYLDAEGNIGMSYIDWVNSQIKDTTVDKTWSQWLFGQGGFEQFKQATKKGVKK